MIISEQKVRICFLVFFQENQKYKTKELLLGQNNEFVIEIIKK